MIQRWANWGTYDEDDLDELFANFGTNRGQQEDSHVGQGHSRGHHEDRHSRTRLAHARFMERRNRRRFFLLIVIPLLYDQDNLKNNFLVVWVYERAITLPPSSL